MVQIIDGELERDGVTQSFKLALRLKPVTVESGKVLEYTIDKLELAPNQPRIDDGEYTLTYKFNGQTKRDRHRIEYGRLLAG
jgi:hypothetical protein